MSTASLFFSKHGKALFVWQAQIGNKMIKLNDNKEYESKMRIASMDVATTAWDFHHEQQTHFGRSAALAYHDGSDVASSHIYIGGASDNYARLSQTDPMEWGPSIVHLKPDGTLNEMFTMKLNNGGYFTVADPIAQIDHMHLDTSQNMLFGTTSGSLSTLNPLPGDNIYIFTVGLLNDGTGKINAQTLQIRKLTMGSKAYVTGVDSVMTSSTTF